MEEWRPFYPGPWKVERRPAGGLELRDGTGKLLAEFTGPFLPTAILAAEAPELLALVERFAENDIQPPGNCSFCGGGAPWEPGRLPDGGTDEDWKLLIQHDDDCAIVEARKAIKRVYAPNK